MSKQLPKRYLSEDSVKKALKIDSFRNLSKDKIMEFASMIPYMDKDVAIAVINQFPVYADFAKVTISYYKQICDSILQSNKDSHDAVVHGYQTILDALSERMRNVETEEERKSITDDMISVADKIAEADLENKKFLERFGTKILFGILAALAITSAAIGVSSKFGGNSLPQLDDDNEDET